MTRFNLIHDLISLFGHDLFGKPVPTFPDHARHPNPVLARVVSCC